MANEIRELLDEIERDIRSALNDVLVELRAEEPE
jgi:hypothetical protein